MWGQNVPEWVILQFATGKMGAVLVTVNPAYKAQELKYVLDQSDSAALFLTRGVKDSDFVEILGQAVPELAGSADGALGRRTAAPEACRSHGGGRARRLPIMSFEELMERGEEVSPEELRERQDSLDADEVINMQYTSGTTGFPKGVQLTHANIVKNAFYIGECMELGPEDRVCMPVPFFHCFGCVLGTLKHRHPRRHDGASRTVRSRAGAPGGARGEVHRSPRGAHHVHRGARAPRLRAVRHLLAADRHHGRLPVPHGGHEEGRRRHGGLGDHDSLRADRVEPGHNPDAHKDPLELRVSTVGRALPETEVRIVDVDAGEDCEPGQQGELWTRGYLVMKGYYKMEDRTREVIDEDGWLHTGDLAVMDGNGYVRITGRAKDMIIRGGENVYPREIEEFLYTHPDVSDVQVYGVPDEKYGEQVAAAIIKRLDSDLTDKGVKEFCREHIARYKVPYYVDFVEEYPMTASGKIQKYKLRETAIERYGLREAAEVEPPER